MADSIEAAYKLVQFSSLIEVSVGINLVFSFWESLRNLAIIRLKEISENVDQKLAANIGEEYRSSRCSTEFEAKKQYHLENLSYLSNMAKWIGMFCTISMVFLLILIGYNPDYMAGQPHECLKFVQLQPC